MLGEAQHVYWKRRVKICTPSSSHGLRALQDEKWEKLNTAIVTDANDNNFMALKAMKAGRTITIII